MTDFEDTQPLLINSTPQFHSHLLEVNPITSSILP